MPSASKRRIFQLDHCFDDFIRRHWKDARFLSMTFAENVTDKSLAEQSWRPVREWFNRKDVEYLGVWERQARGAWHLHLVLSTYIDISEFRMFAVGCGWGPIMRVDRITFKLDDFNAPDPKQLSAQVDRVKRYLLKYLTKGQRDDPSKGVKLPVYSKNCRKCTMCFGWANQIGSRLWRSGAGLFYEIYHVLPGFHDIAFVMRIGFEANWGRDGWEDLLWSRYDCEYG